MISVAPAGDTVPKERSVCSPNIVILSEIDPLINVLGKLGYQSYFNYLQWMRGEYLLRSDSENSQNVIMITHLCAKLK